MKFKKILAAAVALAVALAVTLSMTMVNADPRSSAAGYDNVKVHDYDLTDYEELDGSEEGEEPTEPEEPEEPEEPAEPVETPLMPGDIGTYEEFTFEVLEDGTLFITGYTGEGGNVEIPAVIDEKAVTAIGSMAFSDCASIITVLIPDSVVSVGDGAFAGCTALQFAYIPASVVTIGADAFAASYDNLTVFGLSSSYAETYADENGIFFFALGGTALTDNIIGVEVIFQEGDLTDAAILNVTEGSHGNTDTATYFHIRLLNSYGTEIQPESSVIVKVPVPYGWKDNTVNICYIDDDGAVHKISSCIDNDNIVFITDHFSEFMMTIDEIPEPDDDEDEEPGEEDEGDGEDEGEGGEDEGEEGEDEGEDGEDEGEDGEVGENEDEDGEVDEGEDEGEVGDGEIEDGDNESEIDGAEDEGEVDESEGDAVEDEGEASEETTEIGEDEEAAADETEYGEDESEITDPEVTEPPVTEEPEIEAPVAPPVDEDNSEMAAVDLPIDVIVEVPTIDVTVPSSISVIINPYGLPINIDGVEYAATGISSPVYTIINKSTDSGIKVIGTASVTVPAIQTKNEAGLTEIKSTIQVVNAPTEVSKQTEKSLCAYILAYGSKEQISVDSVGELPNLFANGDPQFDDDTLVFTDLTDPNSGNSAATETIVVLDKAESENTVTYAQFRIAGEVTDNCVEQWTLADEVTLNLVLNIVPANEEDVSD